MLERVWNGAVIVGRFAVFAFFTATISLSAGAFGAYLMLSKHAPHAAAQVEPSPPQTTVEQDETQKLREQLTTERAQNQERVAAWKKLQVSYKAQIAELTAQLNKSTDQLLVLNQSERQAPPPPRTDRELVTKTKQLLGLEGKVLR